MGTYTQVKCVGIALLGAMLLVGCSETEKPAWLSFDKPSLPQLPTSRGARLELGQADLQSQLDKVSKQLEDANAKLGRMGDQLAQIQAQPAIVPPARGASVSIGGNDPYAPAQATFTASGARQFTSIEPVKTYRPTSGAQVRMPGDILFKSGQTELDSQSRQQLAAMAQVLTSDYPGKTVRIEGFSDADPIRTSDWDSNVQLSQQRADSVRRFLEMAGVPAHQIQAIGMGTQKQRATKDLSRRAEVSVVMR